MKTPFQITPSLLGLCLGGFIAIALFACTTTPTAPTDRQQMCANAAEDGITVILAPILANNTSYLEAVQTLAVALGSFSGSTLTPADVDAFLGKVNMDAKDKRMLATMINAAWGRYVLRYQQQLGTSLRPDVSLFLAAVSNGINNAVAATPK